MNRLPQVSGQECVRALERIGCYERRQRGSHIILRRDESFARLVVPDHRELDAGRLRAEVAEATALMPARGDRNLHYVDGLELFGPEMAHMLPDDLHPDAEGYQAMGRNFVEKVAATVFGRAPVPA